MFNLAPDSVYRNCLDSKRGNCPYAGCEKYSVMKCVFDSDKAVDESVGCVPSETKQEHSRYLLISHYPPRGKETFKPNLKFRNIVFASGEVCLDLSGRRHLVDEGD